MLMPNIPHWKYITAMLFLCMAIPASAQSLSEHISVGDRQTIARNAASALAAYESVIALDSLNVDALRKATKTIVSMGEFERKRPIQKALVTKAEQYAIRAFSRDSTSAESHFVMAQALGRAAKVRGPMISVTNGVLVHKHATACLVIQPAHAGCAHVIGAWNAELVRQGAVIMKVAATMSKQPIYLTANWDTAQVYLERAVKAEPNTIIHRLTLGRIYKDRENIAKAREQFLAAQKLPLKDFNDHEYKKQIEEELKKLKELSQS